MSLITINKKHQSVCTVEESKLCFIRKFMPSFSNSDKDNQLASGELLSNDRRVIGFVNSEPRFSVLRALPLYPVSEYENQMNQTRNQPDEKLHKRQTGLIYLLQTAFESN